MSSMIFDSEILSTEKESHEGPCESERMTKICLIAIVTSYEQLCTNLFMRVCQKMKYVGRSIRIV